jgi:hypothetical protein
LQIRADSAARARKIGHLRKGKSDKTFKKFNEWDSYTVHLVSHLIFDGTISRTSCIYNNRNSVLLSAVEKSMKTIYDFPPNRWRNELTGVNRISYHNVALAEYLKAKSIELLKEIPHLSLELKRIFVKSFFDDEGCIDFRPKRNLRQIRGYQKDISILFLIQKLLINLNIGSRVIKPNEVVVSGKENMKRFEEEVNFSPGIKLNENRLNSIWKKSLEKKWLLGQAIASFKN